MGFRKQGHIQKGIKEALLLSLPRRNGEIEQQKKTSDIRIYLKQKLRHISIDM